MMIMIIIIIIIMNNNLPNSLNSIHKIKVIVAMQNLIISQLCNSNSPKLEMRQYCTVGLSNPLQF